MRLFKLVLVIFVLFTGVVYAGEDFSAAKQLIASGVSCDKLTQDQLITIGDYYMELQHPGEAHMSVENMMGGENSTLTRRAHINLAQRFYCSNFLWSTSAIGGMMGGGTMMGYNNGMMGYYYGGWSYFWAFLMIIFWLAIIAALILFVIWLYKRTREQSALEILRKRYAAGDISRKQYEEMKKELSH